MLATTSKQSVVVWFLIRLAIAFAFFYPAVKIHIDPDSWLGYFPAFVKQLPIPQNILLDLFSLFHITIGIWIVWGKHIFIPSVVACFFLAGVIIFNTNQLDIMFRDISLFLVTIALALQSKTN